MSLCPADLVLPLFREIFFYFIFKKLIVKDIYIQVQFWAPQDHPHVQRSSRQCLEWLTECIKAVMLTVTAYYSKRILAKISKGKRCIGQHPAHQVWASSCPLPAESCRQVFPSNYVCQRAASIAKQESSIKPWCPGFHGGQTRRHDGLPTWLTFISSLSRDQADSAWPKASR